ncbi:MAG TPA: tRNA (5-methylaminomethyl-2-thiouridylate)-methyltransferase [Leucothrix mucor]|uniref:tRNA (5-methylaminomethyl-2-thiouridylate)-methyltransferase n=1 Tax=Leucothrix mucor TaxID=45248 RepID=A0A7V2SZG9_LEUMU|nr:tRNA (5-methylaminomethyl-2-thiouridylate)-methyltransferase [Leucothrix mucor]
MAKQRKALSLISGGLDSMLATKAMLEQGIHVEGVNFFTGFCVEGHTQALRKKKNKKPKRNNSLWVADQLGIKLHIVDIVDEYKDIVINPKHGYGANLNPCLDCKIFMVKKAQQWIEEHDFDFIFTGEVIGQRPKSQRKETMPIISAESGANDLLVRPLCAKNLPATKPEREGWIDREQLFDFSGRSRKPQMALAEKWKIDEYAQPAGGCCFLTDPNYSDKLKDLWAHRGDKYYELDDIMLLKIGRHLRPSPHFKMIVSREEGETRFLEGYRKQFIYIKTASHPGPMTLLDGEDISAEDIYLAASIAARYCQGRDEDEVTVLVGQLGEEPREMQVVPKKADEIEAGWLL